MKITILCVGKCKEKYMQQAVAEYVKRLSRYVKMQIIEVPDEKTPEGASTRQEEQIKEKEGKRLLEKIRSEDEVVVLAIEGEQMKSEEFAHQINQYGIRGKGNVVFVIGGSLGLSHEVMKRANQKLSFSKMTFPHQLMRVILLEQIYRSYRIIKKEPYHK